MIRLLLKNLKAFLSAEVPDDVAVCEFDCRKLECRTEDWVNCPRRLNQTETSGAPAETSCLEVEQEVKAGNCAGQRPQQ